VVNTFKYSKAVCISSNKAANNCIIEGWRKISCWERNRV